MLKIEDLTVSTVAGIIAAGVFISKCNSIVPTRGAVLKSNSSFLDTHNLSFDIGWRTE